MIDIHSHVLPKVDDGAASWEETEQIINRMADMGYTRVVATPHWALGMPNIPEETFHLARKIAASRRVQLSMGRECRIHPNLPEHVSQNSQCRIDGGRVVLVELPWGPVPPYTLSVFRQLAKKGYRPVLAHAARHSQLWDKTSPLDALINEGVPIQVNLSTIAGLDGQSSQQRALSLLQKGHVSVVASDIHSESELEESVTSPLEILHDLVGAESHEILTSHNPRALLDSQPMVDLAESGVYYSVNTEVESQLTRPRGIWNRLKRALQTPGTKKP